MPRMQMVLFETGPCGNSYGAMTLVCWHVQRRVFVCTLEGLGLCCFANLLRQGKLLVYHRHIL